MSVTLVLGAEIISGGTAGQKLQRPAAGTPGGGVRGGGPGGGEDEEEKEEEEERRHGRKSRTFTRGEEKDTRRRHLTNNGCVIQTL